MPPSARILQTSSGLLPVAEPPEPLSVDSDVVVILAALLCALICVVGLALVARCAWLRRASPGARPAPPSKGLKKKALRALPKVSYGAATAAGGRLAECPICLAEFAEGDEIRILPQCGHGFHVGCVDTWLVSHSSCPSCRRVLVVAADAAQPSRCQRCGASSSDAAAVAATAAAEEVAKAREDGDANRIIFDAFFQVKTMRKSIRHGSHSIVGFSFNFSSTISCFTFVPEQLGYLHISPSSSVHAVTNSRKQRSSK